MQKQVFPDLTLEQIAERLRDAMSGQSARAWAEQHPRVHHEDVSAVLRCEQWPIKAIREAIGIERKIVYREVGS